MKKEKTRYMGASEEQACWAACTDPRGILEQGAIYVVESKEVHTWHTKIKLVGIQGKFNSVCFEDI